MKEVEKIKCDIEKKTVMLFRSKGIHLSPTKAWETTESIGKTPKKLVGLKRTCTPDQRKTSSGSDSAEPESRMATLARQDFRLGGQGLLNDVLG